MLLIAQASLSVVLLAGAGMLTKSLNNLESQDFGFDPNHRLSVMINQPPANYSQERLEALYRDLQDRLSQVPGMERVALAATAHLPSNRGDGIVVQGRAKTGFDEDVNASWDRVSAGFFETIGQRVLRGRGITELDTANSRRVAVINQTFAKKFFKNEDAIGKHFGLNCPNMPTATKLLALFAMRNIRSPISPRDPCVS